MQLSNQQTEGSPQMSSPTSLVSEMMAQSLGLFAFGAFFAGFLNTKSHADDSKYSNFCLNLEALTHVPKGRTVQNFLSYSGRHLI